MKVKIFRLKGTYGDKKIKAKFNREIRALNESDAHETLFSELGSKHRIKRHLIKIESTEEIMEEEEIKNSIVRSLVKQD